VPADLHIHTCYSDGLDSPAQVVGRAKELGLSAISVCDHDCVGGLGEALEAAQGDLMVITGVEINAEENGAEFHILGYGFPLQAEGLDRLTAWLQQNRLERLGRFMERLRHYGIEVEAEEVLRAAGAGSVGRPHLAKVLAEKGYAGGVQEAFKRYLSPGRPTYVPRRRVSPARAIEIVHEVGGVAVLAHPLHGGGLGDLRKMVQEGLEGIEVGHPEHTEQQVQFLRGVAREWGLLTTGGSDYHGGMMGEGAPIGAVTCSEEEVALLLARAAVVRR